jgi:hypothetical protein
VKAAVARPPADADRAAQAGGDARARRRAAGGAVAALLLASLPAPAGAADTVRISGLSDVAFGSISNFASDSVLSQSVCLFAKSPPGDNYRVTASGSGPGGAFLLSSGTATLPFEVQWSSTPGQSSGSQLLPNQPLTGQRSTSGSASADDCSKGPATTASLVVILRSAALASASSGTYSGTLTLLVAPE